MRLALGAFRTSPVQSLYTEANEPSLQIRCLKLSLQYSIKIKTNQHNPAYKSIPQCLHLYDARPSYIRPFGIRIRTHKENLDINLDNLSQIHFCPVPPWSYPYIYIYRYVSTYLSSACLFPYHNPMYTDGSKIDNHVSAAAVMSHQQYGIQIYYLPWNIFKNSREQNFIVFTDSKSCLQALESLKTNHPVIIDI